MLTFLHFAPAQPVQQQLLAQQLAKPQKRFQHEIFPNIIIFYIFITKINDRNKKKKYYVHLQLQWR